jgi:hypothetical protein
VVQISVWTEEQSILCLDYALVGGYRVSAEHVVSIFRVEVCGFRSRPGYVVVVTKSEDVD